MSFVSSLRCLNRLLAAKSLARLTQSNRQVIKFSPFHSSATIYAKLFSEKHEWIEVDGDVATVGISEYAQNSLGDIVYVLQPEIGQEMDKNDEAGSVESVKAASEIYTPVSGTVTEINTELEKSPKLVNTSCYKDGWIFKLKLSKPEEVQELMDEQKYEHYLKTVEDH